MTKRKLTTIEKVRRHYEKFPDAKHAEVSSALGIDIKYLYVIKNKLKTTGRLPITPAVPLTTITTRESISTMLEPTYRGKILMQAPERMMEVSKKVFKVSATFTLSLRCFYTKFSSFLVLIYYLFLSLMNVMKNTIYKYIHV
jgi:hypothetical protein